MAARRRYRWSFRDATEVRRALTHDAAALAPGELERVPTAGGAEEQPFDQGRRRVRVSGSDENGENYGAELWLPGGHVEAGAPGDRKTGDAALRDLVTPKDGCAEISGLVEWQRRLNAHYRSRS
jgi:hypothetical protein